jgi:hypothetical protein
MNEEIEKDDFRSELEKTLDEQFPKYESKERGAALVLFAEAVILNRKDKKRVLKNLQAEMLDKGTHNLSHFGGLTMLRYWIDVIEQKIKEYE